MQQQIEVIGELDEAVDWSGLRNTCDEYIGITNPTKNDPTDIYIRLTHHLQSTLAVFRTYDPIRDYEKLHEIQQIAVEQYCIHVQLLLILSLFVEDDTEIFDSNCEKKSSAQSDEHKGNVHLSNSETKRIHVQSAQLLCNLGTKNAYTARIILTYLPWSDEYLKKSSWVDVILSAARMGTTKRRAVLEGVIATIHNCIASIQLDCVQNHDAGDMNLFLSMTQDVFFVSTCLRQFFSSATILKDPSTISDDATLWLTYLLTRLSSMGLFENLFHSATGCKIRPSSPSIQVTPEQIIFLHCIAQAVDEYPFGNMHTDPIKKSSPIGNCWLPTSRYVPTHLFLAKIWCDYRRRRRMILLENNATDTDPMGEKTCLETACTVILEILANSLGSHDEKDPTSHDIRIILGKDIPILGYVIQDMAQSIYQLNQRNQASPDASILIDHVRFIGNLCYRCKPNQDLLRTTTWGDELTYDESKDSTLTKRNGLHLLLSCTSFALHCFPLREWTIVAIRNVLEDNEENQNIIGDLESQNVINTPELQSMGIGLKMDLKGNVVIEPK